MIYTLIYFLVTKERMMKKLITIISIAYFALISLAFSTEFNENSVYTGIVEKAYNILALKQY